MFYLSISVHGIFFQLLKGARDWGFTGPTWSVVFSLLAMHPTRMQLAHSNADHHMVPRCTTPYQITPNHYLSSQGYLQSLLYFWQSIRNTITVHSVVWLNYTLIRNTPIRSRFSAPYLMNDHNPLDHTFSIPYHIIP